MSSPVCQRLCAVLITVIPVISVITIVVDTVVIANVLFVIMHYVQSKYRGGIVKTVIGISKIQSATEIIKLSQTIMSQHVHGFTSASSVIVWLM